MGKEILGNLLEKTSNVTFYTRSGKIWNFKTSDIIAYEYENGVVMLKIEKNRAIFIMDKEIEAVAVDLKEGV